MSTDPTNQQEKSLGSSVTNGVEKIKRFSDYHLQVNDEKRAKFNRDHHLVIF